MRLIAFGCSHTYGAFLPDCIGKNLLEAGPHPSSFAWPQLLSDHLGIECINRSVCGASNKEIWHNAVNFDYQKHDIVIFLWSYLNRSGILYNENECYQFLPKKEIDNSKMYFENFYNEYDSTVDFFLRINHITSLLDSRGLLNFHLVVESIDKNKILKWNRTNFLDVDFWSLVRFYPKAADKSHPGIEAHARIAKILSKYIKL